MAQIMFSNGNVLKGFFFILFICNIYFTFQMLKKSCMIIIIKIIIRSLHYYTLNMYLMLVSKFQSMLQMIVSFDVFAYSTLLLHVKIKLRYKKNGYHTALLIVKLHIVSFLPRSLSIDNIRHDVTYLST